jgi:Subtilase family
MRFRSGVAWAAAALTAWALAATPASSGAPAARPDVDRAMSHHGRPPLPAVPASRVARSGPPVGPRVVTKHLDARLEEAASRTRGNAQVVLRGDPHELDAAVTSVNGRTLGSVDDALTAVVPAKSLRALAGRPGVQVVAPSVRAQPLDTSEGVRLTNADAWHSAASPITGSGVKVGIVDAGFKNLGAEVAAGNLPAGLTVAGNYCPDVNGTDHGTAVAEIVHQMAPGAQLFLYCITDDNTFEQAETALQAAGVKIVNSSLAFPGDGRGDGTGAPHSSSSTVRTARLNGILWIQAAGNSADDHWGGSFTDTNHNGLADLAPSGEDDFIGVGSGGGSIYLQWDKWPTSTLPITLNAQRYDDAGNSVGNPISKTQPSSGTPPVLCLEYPAVAGDGCGALPGPGNYDITITVPTSALSVHYDLTYWGDVTGNYLSCGSWNGQTCLGPSVRAQAGSISEPATSPYALAVGAVDARPGTSTCNLDQNVGASYPVEEFSSRGPTIDGRIKPDIAAFDNVSSNVSDLNPFCGTSAAAPHVAGAAALVKAANPAMDPAQIQDFLERRAGTSPPNNNTGHGVLNLGTVSGIAPPPSSRYTPLASPQRILDTRTTIGDHKAPLGAGVAVTVTVQVPSTATAVAINLTGIARGTTYLSVYAGHTSWPGTSNLNLAGVTDSPAAVFATVPLGSGQTITVRNAGAATDVVVDLVGYFAPAGLSKYGAVTPQRILDTRTTTGGHKGVLASGKTITVHLPASAGVPAGANTSVIVNLTATGQVAGGFLALSPNCSHTSSTLNYVTGYTRANLAVVKLTSATTFCVYGSGGPTHVLVDLIGYLAPSGVASYVPVASPVRVIDTRTGNGGRLGSLGAGGTMSYQGRGIFDVPYSATAVFADIVATAGTATSFITVWPGGTRPNVSTVNFSSGRTVSNADVVNLSSPGTATIFNSAGSAHVVVDLFGYFV